MHSLESENDAMQKHLHMVSEKMALLNEQLELAMQEICIVSKDRDTAQCSLDKTQTHLEALKAELVAESGTDSEKSSLQCALMERVCYLRFDRKCVLLRTQTFHNFSPPKKILWSGAPWQAP